MSQLRQVVDALRDRILTGTFAPGTRLMEVPLAAMLGTSRTPIRLALGALERENLVVTAGPRRGFVVASFALEDVFGAIEARGVLEGLAARTCTERGLSADAERRLTDCVERGRALLAAGLDAPEA
ncbi:MAG: GntR family transcriptional regulator, partial [Methylobacteriaceae bacterium]|nr:GntR family transcriptional regulator [Methylobacteriaceae bacterium]